MGDFGAMFGSGMDFMSQRMAEQEEARQKDIDRKREDTYNKQQQENWQKNFDNQNEWANKLFQYNASMNQKNFNYQKQLNETVMAREDNAVQRSVADHQAAGFNKLLAVGNQSAASGMNTTTFNSTSAPSGSGAAGGGVSDFSRQVRTTNFLQAAQVIMDNKVKQSMISKSEAEKEYTAQKTLSEVEETNLKKIEILRQKIAKEKDEYMKKVWDQEIDSLQAQIELARANAGLSNSKRDSENHNRKIAEQYNLPVGTDQRVKNGWQAGSQVINSMLGEQPEKKDGNVVNTIVNKKGKFYYIDREGRYHEFNTWAEANKMYKRYNKR